MLVSVTLVTVLPLNRPTVVKALVLGTSAFTTVGLVNGNTVTSRHAHQPRRGQRRPPSAVSTIVVPSLALGTGLTNYTITYANGTLAVGPGGPRPSRPTTATKAYGHTLTCLGTSAFTTVGAAQRQHGHRRHAHEPRRGQHGRRR